MPTLKTREKAVFEKPPSHTVRSNMKRRDFLILQAAAALSGGTASLIGFPSRLLAAPFANMGPSLLFRKKGI